LEDVLGRLMDASFGAPASGAYEAEVKRAVEGVVVERIEWLARNASMPQVRAISTAALQETRGDLVAMADDPHAALLALDIQRFLERPADAVSAPEAVEAPPGAPIGDPAMDWMGLHGIGQAAMDWLGHGEPWCTWAPGL
jgi:hypothetical protein